MKAEPLIRAALLFGGAMTGVIAIGHIFLPTFGYDPAVAQSLTAPVRDHFYFLGTYAICSFLFAFAGLSLYFAFQVRNPATPLVSALLALVWIARFVMELIFPVALPIFFLAEPHVPLAIVTATIALSYSVAALAGPLSGLGRGVVANARMRA